ncbi:hypothetical protein [Psychroserpens mesophilus]|uniref:hypothetical protein n=1 Tax=Psychroserpens mesophilus TaxID=325473 RepID=UPI0005901942|nr:hypothetical protein [Psychroserpens mesophilus]
MILPALYFYWVLESLLNKNQIVFERMINGIGLIIIFIIVSIIIFIYKYQNLKFKTLEFRISVKQFHEVVELTKSELKWTILTKKDNYIFAYSKKSMFSWGEQITIIREKNHILINSICKTHNTSLFGNNQRNIESFERNLKKANAQQRV